MKGKVKRMTATRLYPVPDSLREQFPTTPSTAAARDSSPPGLGGCRGLRTSFDGSWRRIRGRMRNAATYGAREIARLAAEAGIEGRVFVRRPGGFVDAPGLA